MIANQLAELYQPTEYGLRKYRDGLSTEQILNEKDLQRLNPKNINDYPLVFVCQPGRDELDESLLQAIGVGSSFLLWKNLFYFFLYFKR